MSAVKQAQRALDFEARRYNTIAVMLLNNPNVQNVIDIESASMLPEHALSIQRIRALIGSSLSSVSESTSGIQLYLNRSGYLIDGSHGLPVDQYYISLAPNEYESWTSTLAQRYTRTWLCMENDAQEHVYFFSTLSQGGSTNSSATFQAEVRSAYLDDLLRPLSAGYGEWAAVYGGGNLIYQSGTLPISVDWTQLNQQQGQFIASDYMISYIRSEVTDDFLVNAISRQKLLSPLRSLQTIMYVLLFVCFVICGLLSYLLAVRAFNPLRSLVAMTSGNQTGDDEYAILREKLVEAADEKRRLLNRASMDKQLKQDHENYRRIIDSNTTDALPHGGDGYYCLAQIVLIDYTDNCAPAEAMLLIRDVFDFGSRPCWQASAYQQGNELTLLIHLERMIPTALNEVTEQLASAVQCVRDDFAADCLVGLSSVHTVGESPQVLLRNLEWEARAALHTSVQGQSVYTYQPNNMLEHAFRRLLLDSSQNANLDQALETFVQEARVLLAPKENDNEGSEYSLKRQVIDIVKKQYADPSLNVSLIASQLGRSADYVSKVFKQTTLIGMLDYIHHTRVSAAKRLLVECRDMTVSEVSTSVGYVSVDSFIRAFKRIFGVTPGEYRKSATKTESADD